MSQSNNFPSYIPIFSIILILITIAFEILTHQHIIELNLPKKWRLAVYFNLLGIVSFELGVLVHHYPHYIITILCLLCPIFIGFYLRFWKPFKLR